MAGLFEQHTGPLEPPIGNRGTSGGGMPKGGINWSLPFMHIPILTPSGVYYLGLPTYGLHGGPNYTDGQFGTKDLLSKDFGIDATDEAFRTHDDAYTKAQGDPEKKLKADRTLIDHLNAIEILNKEGLLQNPKGEYYTYGPNSDEAKYNRAARWYFGTKTRNKSFLSGRGENAAPDASLHGGLNDLPLPDQSEGLRNLSDGRGTRYIPPRHEFFVDEGLIQRNDIPISTVPHSAAERIIRAGKFRLAAR